MQQHRIRIDDIVIGERHRALSADACTRLAASLKEIGLRQPISIRLVDEMEVDGDLTAGVPVLVAGAHRLAAAKTLGWSHIDCIEVDDDAIKAEMWEIAENLHRLDLTKEQRDEHIRRYIELVEASRAAAIVVQNEQQLPPRPVGRPKSVTTEVAEATGLSRQTIQRAMNPPPKLSVVNPAPAPIDVFDAIEKQVAALMNAWNRAGPEARGKFLESVDSPGFDRTVAGARYVGSHRTQPSTRGNEHG